ncbi:MAG: hypothetical protein QOF48_602 [Verrucomicrobiota bacterium]|jgi:hypothetical protein
MEPRYLFTEFGGLGEAEEVDRRGRGADTPAVSTMAEIEAAIERLPAAQVQALAVWLVGQRSNCASTSAGAFDDLESLAGSWVEEPAFDSAVLAFEQVNEAMWR